MNEINLDLDVLWVRAEGNFVSDMDGEKVMLSVKSGKYYNLGKVGGRIWDLLENPMTGYELIEQMMTEYAVERQVCMRQVQTFLKQLVDEHLLSPAISEGMTTSAGRATSIGVTEA